MDKWWDHGFYEGQIGDREQIIYPYLTAPMLFCVAGDDNCEMNNDE